MKTKIAIPIILLSFSLCAIGCSDLSRGKAKDIILDKKDANWYLITMSASLNSGLGGYDISCNEISSENNNSFKQKLVDAGYLDYKLSYFGLKYFDLTNKILPFKISEQFQGGLYYFKLAEIEDVNITGISGSDNYKEVEFTISYKPNDMGKLVLESSSLNKNKALTFKKFDDGWRIN
jgi:hypothetical protein